MLRISHVDAREPVYAGGEMFFGIGPILRPPAGGSSSAGDRPESAATSIVGILDAKKMKFCVRREVRVRGVGPAAKASKPPTAEPLRKRYGCQRHKASGY